MSMWRSQLESISIGRKTDGNETETDRSKERYSWLAAGGICALLTEGAENASAPATVPAANNPGLCCKGDHATVALFPATLTFISQGAGAEAAADRSNNNPSPTDHAAKLLVRDGLPQQLQPQLLHPLVKRRSTRSERTDTARLNHPTTPTNPSPSVSLSPQSIVRDLQKRGDHSLPSQLYGSQRGPTKSRK
eukprot:COSAG02_NODE_38_length_48090_cov_107.207060_14_plen_192_part_00